MGAARGGCYEASYDRNVRKRDRKILVKKRKEKKTGTRCPTFCVYGKKLGGRSSDGSQPGLPVGFEGLE